LIITGITVLFFLLVGILHLGLFIDFPWQGFIEAGNLQIIRYGLLDFDVLCCWNSFLFLALNNSNY
jgi:hypothetical protein